MAPFSAKENGVLQYLQHAIILSKFQCIVTAMLFAFVVDDGIHALNGGEHHGRGTH